MAVVTGWIALSFTGELSEPAPIAAQTGHVEVSLENQSVASQDMVLVHRGGDPVDTDRVSIRIDTGAGTITATPDRTGDVADGSWSVGEQLPVGLNTTQVCQGSGEVDVQVIYEGETNAKLATTTVPIIEGGFTIEDGAVVPVSEYTAEATVLGTGFTYGVGGPDITIWLDVQIGNKTYDPWPGNVNNNGNPRSHTFDDLPAGAGMAVGATADPHGNHISPRTRWSNESNGYVYVLRDGDTPPNIQGFGDQTNASSYVAPYLDGNGTIDLQDNQAIYLFELGGQQTGPAADFQDVVVLVTLTTEQQTGVARTGSGQSVLICPSDD